MTTQKRIVDYGITTGKLRRGRLNKITDVKGVKVGHCTIDTDKFKTGVTVILPHGGNIFRQKLVAASYVLNGFGKSVGLMQIDELGSLETPIALTNTLNVGLVFDALVGYILEALQKEKMKAASFNPVVCECNDSYLNNICERAVKKEHVIQAIENACEDFDEGDVGGGKGMSCHQLKGGIGSASRIVELDEKEYTLGVLVQSNHGMLEDLIVDGRNIGKDLVNRIKVKERTDKGSIIIIIATDIPCSSRQLKRICKRAGVGLARVGSYTGHGSGEVIIGFSTANIIVHDEKRDIVPIRLINENRIDKAFRAAAEACEEAVLNSMITAGRVAAPSGNTRESLKDYL